MQTALGRVDALASAPTLSRMETRATRGQIWALHEVLVEQFSGGPGCLDRISGSISVELRVAG
jgi:hypothetical protein